MHTLEKTWTDMPTTTVSFAFAAKTKMFRSVFNRSLNFMRSRTFSALPRRKIASYGLGLAASGVAACSIAAWSMEETPLAFAHGSHSYSDADAIKRLEQKVAELAAKVFFRWRVQTCICIVTFTLLVRKIGCNNSFVPSTCTRCYVLLCMKVISMRNEKACNDHISEINSHHQRSKRRQRFTPNLLAKVKQSSPGTRS